MVSFVAFVETYHHLSGRGSATKHKCRVSDITSRIRKPLREGRRRRLVRKCLLFPEIRRFCVRGLIDLNHLVFFLTLTGFFLFLTVKRLEVRRWQ